MKKGKGKAAVREERDIKKANILYKTEISCGIIHSIVICHSGGEVITNISRRISI